MPDSAVYRHFRKPEGDGGSKDWAIAVCGEEIRIRHGISHQTVRMSVVPSSNFRYPSPDEEVTYRVTQKQNDGYIEIGCAEISRGRLVEIDSLSKPDLFWEIRSVIPMENMLACMDDLVSKFETCPGLADVRLVQKDVTVCYGEERWAFGFGEYGGLTADGRGGGKLASRHGPWPILFLLGVDRAFPGSVCFVDETSEVVRPAITRGDLYLDQNSTQFDQIVRVGAALELCPLSIQWDSLIADDQCQSRWF